MSKPMKNTSNRRTLILKVLLRSALPILVGFFLCEFIHIHIDHRSLMHAINCLILLRSVDNGTEESEAVCRNIDEQLSKINAKEQAECQKIVSSLMECRQCPSATTTFVACSGLLTNGVKWTRWRYDWNEGVEIDGAARTPADVFGIKESLAAAACFENARLRCMPPMTNDQQRFSIEATFPVAANCHDEGMKCLSDDTVELLLSTPVANASELKCSRVVRTLHEFFERKNMTVSRIMSSDGAKKWLNARLWYHDYEFEVFAKAQNERDLPLGADVKMPLAQAYVRKVDLKRTPKGDIDCKFVFAIRGFEWMRNFKEKEIKKSRFDEDDNKGS